MGTAPPCKKPDPIKELIPWARDDAIVQAFEERERERKEILEMIGNFRNISFLPEDAREIFGNIEKRDKN